MKIIRRRPVAVAAAPAPTSEAPRRVLRFANKANNATVRAIAERVARAEIDLELQSLAKEEEALDKAAFALEQRHSSLEAKLRAANLTEHSDGIYKIGIEESFSRQSTTIDAKKFKNAVTDKEFWAVVTVPVTKAKDLLGQKEIDAISEVERAKSLGHVFKLKRLDKRVK